MGANWQYSNKKLCFSVPLITAIALTFSANKVVAQVTPDQSLGKENSVVTPVNPNAERIDGGAVRGSNLFHSFKEFNVDEGQRVDFANPTGVENIFSRVTGNNSSNIFGTLGVLGNANLFLLNPNGIIFGPNARLDIRGSFVASTGKGITFADRTIYGDNNLGSKPLLTMAVPVGLQYGTEQAGNINNEGNLQVGEGQKLALAGNTVTTSGKMKAPGGTVHVLGERVGLLDNAQIDVSGERGGGNVLIGGDFQGKGEVPNAKRTFVGSGANIIADALTSGDGGRVIVWADETTGFNGKISARGGSQFGNGGFAEVSGKENLIFRGDVDLGAGNGSFGTLLLDPTDITIIDNVSDSSGVKDELKPEGSNAPADIFASDFAQTPTTISQKTLEELGEKNTVKLEATNNIIISDLKEVAYENSPNKNQLTFEEAPGQSITFKADADGNGVGSFIMNQEHTIRTNGRDIEISGAGLKLGDINTSAESTNGGNITLTATNGDIETRYITSSSNSPRNGDAANAGSVTMTADNGKIIIRSRKNVIEDNEDTIAILANSIVFPGVSGNSKTGGRISLKAKNGIDIIGKVNSQSAIKGIGDSGNAGAVTISTSNGNIKIDNPSGSREAINAMSSSGNDRNDKSGNGGKINLIADNGGINLSGHIISLSEGTRASGNAETITIEAPKGIIDIQGLIWANSTSANAGNGANIKLNAGGDITTLSDIFSFSSGNGKGGDITFNSRNGSIDTLGNIYSASKNGVGGIIKFTAAGNIFTGNISTGDISFIQNPFLNDLFSGGNVKGENITLISNNGAIDTRAGIVSTISTNRDGGNITFEADNNITTGNIFSNSLGSGKGGDITFISRNGNVDTSGSQVYISTNDIDLEDLFSGSNTKDEDIAFITNSDAIDINAGIVITSSKNGDGGTIEFTAADNITTANIFSNSLGNGKGGDITFTTDNGYINTRSGIINSAFRNGVGGIIEFNAAGNIFTGNISTGDISFIEDASSDGNVKAGDIFFTSDSGIINTSLGIVSTVSTNSDGGDIEFKAAENIFTGNVFSNSLNSGKGGDITFTSNNDAIDTSLGTVSSTSWNDDGGKINFNAAKNITTGSIISILGGDEKIRDISLTSSKLPIETITLTSSNGDIDTSQGIISAFSRLSNNSNGDNISLNANGGNISFNAKNGNISSGSIESIGLKGGSIILNSSNKISINQDDIASISTGNSDKGNNIELNAPTISLTDARIASLSTGDIHAGDIIVKASEGVEIINTDSSSPNLIGGQSSLFQNLKERQDFRGTGLVSTTFQGNGDTGNITINTKKLNIENNASKPSKEDASDELTNLAGIGTLTFRDSTNNAGDITVNASESITIIGNGPEEFNPASGSDINKAKKIATDIQLIRTGITSGTQGEGNAGKTTINTGNLEIKNGATITSGITNIGKGEGNEITVNAETITLSGQGGLATATLSSNNTSDASNINVNANQITLLNGALIAADTFGPGKGGDLNINTNELNVNSGSRISAATFDTGQGGTIRINSSTNKAQVVQIQGVSANGEARSGIFSDTRASGNAGDVEIYVDRLNIQDSGQVSVSSFESGLSGNMNINADQVNLKEEASITADTFGSAKGGNLTINSANLSIINGSRVAADTSGTGNGGTAKVTASEKIIIDGKSSADNKTRSSLSASSEQGGKAGDLNISTRVLEVLNGGQIAVSSKGENSISGNMLLTTDSLLLKNQASINALTESTEGGNINLKVANDIEFEGRDSEISSEALLENAGGGNLTIEAGRFILSSGVPNNNDVVVTAAGRGVGGKLSATSKGAFGFVNFNKFRTPDSDFSAASRQGQDGTLSLITDNPEPQLPQQPNTPEIVQVCPSSQGVTTRAAGRSEFFNTGHGGLPPSPNEALESNTAQVPWVTLKPQENKPTTASKPKIIREAQGWVKMPNGKLLLTTRKSNSSSSSCVFQSN